MPVPARFVATLAVLSTLAFGVSLVRGAELIYDNSGPGDPTGVWYSTLEIGDEIILGTNITSHVLTQLQIEYFGDFTPSGDETIQVRIYKNDGVPTKNGFATPGTLLYDSGPYNIKTNYETWTSTFLNVTLPDDMTWTVQFSGLTGAAGDRAGLLFRSPPTVGTSFNDAWRKNDSGWQTVVFTKPANFAARLTSDLPKLNIRVGARNGKGVATVVLEWTGTAILQVAATVNGEYQDLPQFRNRYECPLANAGAMKFWRLRD
jgi:hypothetical protein